MSGVFGNDTAIEKVAHIIITKNEIKSRIAAIETQIAEMTVAEWDDVEVKIAAIRTQYNAKIALEFVYRLAQNKLDELLAPWMEDESGKND